MFQRRLKRSCNRFHSFILRLFLCLIGLSPGLLFSQTDTLQITFDAVSIQDTTIFQGRQAGFPSPVLSLITIKDHKNRYVHGLADTTRWLSPSDTTQKGVVVDSIWNVIQEYHRDEPTRPDNRDVKQMTPAYEVTEVFGIKGISVALAMDYSGGFIPYYDDAEYAARKFIYQMKSDDRVSVVKFGGDAKVLQTFTSDTTLLIQKINKDYIQYHGTALYDAIYLSLEQCLAERNRKNRTAVIVYTDGGDSAPSKHSLKDVVDYAQWFEIPVFTIGLGDSLQHTEIKEIADQTGGLYKYSPSVNELESIYLAIYGILRGYYVLAHTSTDPYNNGTLRTVDVSIKYDNMWGRGAGNYRVPDIASDVMLSKKAKTKRFTVQSNGDTLYQAATGDTITYSLFVTNSGPSDVQDVTVTDILPELITPVDTDENPVIWSIPHISAGETVTQMLLCVVDTILTRDPIFLVNAATLSCPMDSTGGNNTAGDSVSYIPLTPADADVQKKGVGSHFTVASGDTTWYVSPGDTAQYMISVVNQGELDCRDILVQDILPDLLQFFNTSHPDIFHQDGRTLSWTIDKLKGGGGRLDIIYRCFVDTLMLPGMIPLVNHVTAICADDSNTANNIASDTLMYVPLLPADIVASKRGVGDSLAVNQGDSTWYVSAGNWVDYTISLVNLGQVICRDILIRDIVPEEYIEVRIDDTTAWQRGDTLYWHIDALAARGGHADLTYACRLDTVMPPYALPLINNVLVTCADDTTKSNNAVSDTVWSAPLIPPDPSVRVSPVEAGESDSVRVEVMTPVEIKSWDLTVFFESGLTNNTYGDPFIALGHPDPGIWTVVKPRFGDTWLSITGASEQVGVIFETVDLWDVTRTDTAFFTLNAEQPEIRVNPAEVQPGDSVAVEVYSPISADTWDLSASFEDGYQITTYADLFIIGHPLAAGVWTAVDPDFGETWMRMGEESERITMILTTLNPRGISRSASTSFLVRSSDTFLLDDNVFKPGLGGTLGLRYKLSSNRRATIRLFDVSGAFIKMIFDGPAKGGWNTATWDGRDESGRAVGSGVYVAVLMSGSFQKAQKFILVR